MGEDEAWPESGGPLPNGLLPGAGHVMRALDTERWMMAEERTTELIACIQPNQLSEERRNAVANYVQQLIMNCFPCQVCTFGSVPLKTYLPDGDIDLTAFSHDQNLTDTWANQVHDILQNEEKNENAEFHVKEVQYIQAEVKIIKCLVENIVVDISFNQVGGLCTLCFLDEVDNLINQNHLLKRSIILVKAWCYYESRILGAHHGLISTYALETLVLYIFHVFNNSFHGPLEVLYRFLEFFGKFDWDNFCVSLWGPVPINSLPDVTADPPRKDSGELLLSKLFLDACSSVYAVFPGGQEHNGQPFLSKHFNVIDPLRVNNNLGRSVSKGNFFRIRSAFAFGAKRLARLLDCPKENLILEVNKFFRNTWERHGSGQRPDAAGVDLLHKRVSTPDVLYDSGNPNNVRGKNVTENSVVHEKRDKIIRCLGVSSQPGRISAKMIPKSNELSTASRIQSLKNQNLNSLQVTEQMGRENVSERVCLHDGIQKDLKADHFANDTQGRFLFARTHSSPELTDGCVDLLSQSRSHRQAQTTYAHGAKMDVNNGKNHGSESLRSNINHSSVEDTSFVKNAFSEEIPYTPEAQVMNQEEQDIMRMMASASIQSFDGQFHVPFNLNSAHIPFSIPPSFLASMGYPQRSLSGFVPTNVPLINPSFTNVQFPHSLDSPQFTQSSNGFVVKSPSESFFERNNENFNSVVINSEEAVNDFWQEQDVCSSTGCDPENGNQCIDKPPALISGSRYVPPPRESSSASAMRVQQKHTREKHGSLRQNNGNFPNQDDRGSDLCAEERSTSSTSSSAAHSNSLRSRTSSESSWDGSSLKISTSTNEKRGKKIVSVDLATSHLKGQIMSVHVLNQTEDDDQKYAVLSNKGSEMAGRIPGCESIASLQVPRHHISGSEAAQTNGADSMIPLAPMLIDPGLRQRMNDNSGLVAFYPTGPPIPFLTMLPIYNVPSEKGTSDAASGHCGDDETLINSESMQNLSPVDLDNSEDLNPSSSLKENIAAKTSETKTPDILNSDFASHWQNLQLGRFCQDPRPHGPVLYPSPVMVPPTYLHGRIPYDNTGRPLPTNANVFSQLMTSYGPCLVPVAPLQSVSGRPLNVYQHYMDDMPRYRSGTGTYLPNPKVFGRERHSTGTRRGSYNDRNDSYGDREGNWNGSSKSRAGRIHSRNQNDRFNSRTDRLAPVENQPDHSWNTYRHETTPSYQCQNGPLNSNSHIDGPQNVAYTMFPLSATNPNGISNGPSGPPVVVLYPFDHNAAYGFHGEQLEFGSLGHVDLPGVDEQSHLNEGTISRAVEAHRHNGDSMLKLSPDQPSSPHHKRKI